MPFNSPAMNVTGGVGPYTFSVVGTLPAGLTLNTSTGAITGTPTAAGTFSIQVTDANGVVAAGTNCAVHDQSGALDGNLLDHHLGRGRGVAV